MHPYHFGISGQFIWGFHILMGLYFAFIGYKMLNNQKITQFEALYIMFIGILASLYHAHLWFIN